MTDLNELISTLNKFITKVSEQNKQSEKDGSKQPFQEAIKTHSIHFESFNEEEETFGHYIERLEIYFEIKGWNTNSEDDSFCKYKGLFLINSLGPKYYKLLSSLTTPDQPSNKPYDELVKILKEHLSPRKNVLTEQHKFFSRVQNEDESISNYIAALKECAKNSEFSSLCNDSKCTKANIDLMIRAQMIRGMHDPDIREKILQLGNLTLEKAIDVALAVESSKIDNKHVYTSHASSINKIVTESKYKNAKQTNKNTNMSISARLPQNGNQSKIEQLGLFGLCLHCGKNNHASNECRIINKLKCNFCKKQGHLQKVCISYHQETQEKNQSVKQIDNNELDDVDHDINRIIDVHYNNDSNDDRMIAQVLINGKCHKFECDSGSRVSLINFDDFQNLKLEVPIKKTQILFRSYTGQVFSPIGVCKVNVNYQNQSSLEDLYIVDLEKSAILGRTWIRNLKINLHEIKQIERCTTTQEIKTTIDNIKTKYASMFAPEVGKVSGFKCSLRLKENAQPIFLKSRPVPHALKILVEEELDKLECQDIIEKVDQSEWGTPIVVIPKPNGSIRICADYKQTVNKQLHDGRYPIPRIEDIFNNLRNGKYFCTLDIHKAYLHVPVDDESAKIQAITTHKGTYLAKRLFFGIKTAPNEFHKFIDQVVQDLEGTIAYFDDIIIQGKSFEECKLRLIKTLDKLQTYDLHVNVEKCKFFEKQVQYLGHIISHEGIQKTPDKVKAIKEAPRPTDVDGVRQFLGMVQYYSKFIKDASSLLFPLNKLLRKDVKFRWTPECETSFLHIKSVLSSDTVLTPFNPDLPVLLATDASPFGISAILSHRMPNNDERPIMFASRSLTTAERNYSQLDREATAVNWGFKKFFDYIYGRKFTLLVDNKPLMAILHPDKRLPLLSSTRMLRYAQFLSGFDYDVIHKTSAQHTNADYFSRHPISSLGNKSNLVDDEHIVMMDTVFQITNETVTANDIAKETSSDEELCQLKDNLLSGKIRDPELSLQDGILFRGQRVVIPKKLQPPILQELHSTHVGIVKMKALARNYCYWKSIDSDIETLVKSCKECCDNKSNPVKAPLHVWDTPTRNWQRVHMDYAGPFLNHNFLIVVDARSKWPEIYSLKNSPTSENTIHFLREIFSHQGLPEVLVSDNATIFKSDEFSNFCKRMGIRQRFSAPGNPSTNGLAERYVQILKTKLKCMKFEPGTLHQKLCKLLFRFRTTPLSSGQTPAEMMLGRNLRTVLDLLRPTEPDYNKASQPFSDAKFCIGERVQSRNYSGSVIWKYGTVAQVLGKVHYLIQMDEGYTIKRHHNQLRSCKVPKPLNTGNNKLHVKSEKKIQKYTNNQLDQYIGKTYYNSGYNEEQLHQNQHDFQTTDRRTSIEFNHTNEENAVSESTPSSRASVDEPIQSRKASSGNEHGDVESGVGQELRRSIRIRKPIQRLNL